MLITKSKNNFTFSKACVYLANKRTTMQKIVHWPILSTNPVTLSPGAYSVSIIEGYYPTSGAVHAIGCSEQPVGLIIPISGPAVRIVIGLISGDIHNTIQCQPSSAMLIFRKDHPDNDFHENGILEFHEEMKVAEVFDANLRKDVLAMVGASGQSVLVADITSKEERDLVMDALYRSEVPFGAIQLLPKAPRIRPVSGKTITGGHQLHRSEQGSRVRRFVRTTTNNWYELLTQ